LLSGEKLPMRMLARFFACVFWLAVASPLAGSEATALSPPDLAGASIVVVQAHPDDEQNLAPMLAEACRFGRARCHFVVLADGNSHGCAIVSLIREARPTRDPAVCSAQRRAEIRASAKLLGGTVEFLGLDDLFYAYNDRGRDRTLREWSEASGGQARLVKRIARILRNRRTTVMFTLDPRHGSSCHAGHRAATALALEAVARLPAFRRPAVWFEETSDLGEGLTAEQVAELENGGMFVWPQHRGPVAWYDGGRLLADGKPAHAYRDAVHRIHATQDLTPATPISAPSAERLRLPLVRLADVDPDEDQCTGLDIRIPTWDVPGNRERFLARIEDALR
jgi:LmbE family N-acetylglucosaminyl deacetylase